MKNALTKAVADAAELLDGGPRPTEGIYVWRSRVDDWLSRPEVVAAREESASGVRDDAQQRTVALDRAIEEAALIWEAYLPLEDLQRWLANPVVVAARERAKLAGPAFDLEPDDVAS